MSDFNPTDWPEEFRNKEFQYNLSDHDVCIHLILGNVFSGLGLFYSGHRPPVDPLKAIMPGLFAIGELAKRYKKAIADIQSARFLHEAQEIAKGFKLLPDAANTNMKG